MAGLSAAEEYRRRLGQYSDIRGHLAFLHETALAYPEPVIIELGVAWGNSTSALLAAAGEAGGTLWSVDAGEVHDTGMIPADWRDDPHWRFLKADDLSARGAGVAARGVRRAVRGLRPQSRAT